VPSPGAPLLKWPRHPPVRRGDLGRLARPRPRYHRL